ncbi:unnamed protein product [Diamesa hyperborea]
MIVNIIRESSPEITHECPYKGFVKVINMTMDLSKSLSIYPQGDYRSHWIQHHLDYKYGTVYRPVFKAEVEWCGLMKQMSKNLLFDMVVNIMRDTAPEITHECPYSVITEENYHSFHC